MLFVNTLRKKVQNKFEFHDCLVSRKSVYCWISKLDGSEIFLHANNIITAKCKIKM